MDGSIALQPAHGADAAQQSPTGLRGPEYYKEDFLRYRERIGFERIEFRSLLPSIFLPSYLRNVLGYQTSAMVSMPVSNHNVPLNRDFDFYELMPHHNDMAAMIEKIRFDGGRPWFHLLNVGETHYPYALPSEDPSEWPRISGVHGVFKHLDDLVVGGRISEGDEIFDLKQLERLRLRQVRAALTSTE